MKFNKTILAAFAVALPLSAGMGSALSYFTANVAASASVPVAIVPNTDIGEEIVNMEKRVVIKNTGEVPVYIRLKAFAGSEYTLEIGGTNWSPTENRAEGSKSDSDRYYEYGMWVAPEASTEKIVIKIKDKDGNPIKAGTDIDAFNVVVVYERTSMVEHDKNGNMIYMDAEKTVPKPDWDYVVKGEEPFPVDKSGIVIPKAETEGGNE